jgi:hypothetical protein
MPHSIAQASVNALSHSLRKQQVEEELNVGGGGKI